LSRSAPVFAVVGRCEELARAGSEVQAGRPKAICREAIAEDRQMGVVLRQTVSQRAPRTSFVFGLPYDAMSVGRAAILIAFQRQQVRGAGLCWMRHDRKAEVHSGDARHRLPRVTAVVAAVDASVVLQIE